MRNKAAFLTLTALVLALCVPSHVAGRTSQDAGAVSEAPTLSVEAMKEDLKVLLDVLEEGHGGFDRYTPAGDLRKMLDGIAAGLTGPLTEFEFYVRLLPFIASIKDGHTGLRLSSATALSLESQAVFFPFGLRFAGGKTFIFRNLSRDPGIEAGAELLAVNGMPMTEVLPKLMELMPSDAGIASRKIRQLESPGMFGRLFALRFGLPGSYRLSLRRPGSAEAEERTVPAVKGSDISALLRERYPDAVGVKPLYELSFRGTTAVLAIRGFADAREQGAIPYREFLARTFKTLRDMNVPALVIDLRANGGGNDEYGKLLVAYFMSGPFDYYRALECKKASYDLFRYTSTAKEAVDELATHVKRNARGWYDIIGHPNTGPQQPQTPQFRGRTAILIDGLSFSATGETTTVFHHHRKAVFFGEECGAGYYGNSSGFMTLVTLPRTRLQLRVPLTSYTMAADGYPKDRGIVPDFPVEPTIEDLLAGRDPVMDRALKYLTEKKP